MKRQCTYLRLAIVVGCKGEKDCVSILQGVEERKFGKTIGVLSKYSSKLIPIFAFKLNVDLVR